MAVLLNKNTLVHRRETLKVSGVQSTGGNHLSNGLDKNLCKIFSNLRVLQMKRQCKQDKKKKNKNIA